MQRNMDLVRMILMRLETSPSGWAPNDLGIKSFPPEQIGYHVHIMMQEGLIEGNDVTTMHPQAAINLKAAIILAANQLN